MFAKHQFVRMHGPDMVFVLGVDNFYSIVVPKNLSGDAATPEEVASVTARIVKMGAPSVMFEVGCEITTNNTGFAVALAEFDKDRDYTGIDAGNILYLQFIINLANADQIVYPEPPQRLVVTRPSWLYVEGGTSSGSGDGTSSGSGSGTSSGSGDGTSSGSGDGTSSGSGDGTSSGSGSGTSSGSGDGTSSGSGDGTSSGSGSGTSSGSEDGDPSIVNLPHSSGQ